MNKHLAMVRDFHTAFKLPQSEAGKPDPELLTQRFIDLRQALLLEELSEIMKAWAAGDLVKLMDGYVDLAYFALGGLAIMGEGVVANSLTFNPSARSIYRDPAARADRCVKSDLRSRTYAAVEELTLARSRPLSAKAALSTLYWACAKYTGDYFELPFDELFLEVHFSNMSKLGADGEPIYSDAGKILKGPNFREPNLATIIGDVTL